MYLQITTKCNHHCQHCAFSCTMRGKHMTWNTFIDAVSFIRNCNNEIITIGGGEPTLHPRFFDILKICLEDFEYVWMATNGSQTKTMFRLANIIKGEDYPDCDCEDVDYCDCEGGIYQENKLTVALSQDYFHDDINPGIVSMWNKYANQHRRSNFEIRDVTKNYEGVRAQGRAKKNNVGWSEDCICSDFIIKPDGKVKLCGCEKSPIIGNVWDGISKSWENKMNKSEKYYETRCYKEL